MIRVVRFREVASFLDRSRDWLLSNEAENNLVLGVTGQLQSGPHPFEEPIYLSAVENDGQVVGCCFRTPPFGLGLTRMPVQAIPPLVEDVSRVFHRIPLVIGPKSSTIPFASEWSARMDCAWRVEMEQMIYAATVVRWPSKPVEGTLRLATRHDADMLQRWASAFQEETHIPMGNEGLAGSLIDEKCLFVWEDVGPRTMAAARGPTPNGIRISFVYTPPEWRGRGYASVCVAAVSKIQLEAGKSMCFLYTDLTNPTSNAIYQRIGYEPVCDSLMCRFHEASQ